MKIDDFIKSTGFPREPTEYRSTFKVRAVEPVDADDLTTDYISIEGKAVVFNLETVLYKDEEQEIREVILPEAFKNTDLTDVVFVINHDDRAIPIARTRNNSLSLSIGTDGVTFRANIHKSYKPGVEVYDAIREGLLDSCSFRFTTGEDPDIEYRDNNVILFKQRNINKLYDVSAVTFPAYQGTEIGCRSKLLLKKEEDDEAKTKKLKLLKMIDETKF